MKQKNILRLCWKLDTPPVLKAMPYQTLLEPYGYRTHIVALADLFKGRSVSLLSLQFYRVLWQLRRFCRDNAIDIVVTHRYKPFLLASMLACVYPFERKLASFHGLGEFKKRRRRWHARLFARDWQLIGISTAVKDDIAAAQCGFKSTHVICNAIDIDKTAEQMLPREQARAALNIPADAFVFGTIGRCVPKKGHCYLLDAFKKLQLPVHYKLVIIGGGRDYEALKAQVDAQGLAQQVTLAGETPQASRYLKAFDTFILSSTSEGLPMALLEACVAKLPVITTTAGGMPEVLGDTGMVVEIANASMLAEAMGRVQQYDDAQRRESALASHQRVVAHFSLAGHAKTYDACLRGAHE